MKKYAVLLLSLILLVSMCACAGKTPSDQPPGSDPTTVPTNSTGGDTVSWDDYEIITIAEALDLCGEAGNITEERYYLRGTVVSIDNASYGAMTIQDDTGSISVYGTYSEDGSINYSEMNEKPFKGDEVLLHCILQNYNGTKEVKNARLIDFVAVKQEIDESAYAEGSIADARAAQAGTKVKVDGVVARITYANGMIPSGFYLIDETNSIYVYDSELAARVKEGNKITILAAKDYWILDKEQTNAQKFGYKGCNQLTDATLVSNDNSNNEFDKGWIQTSTVKEIMDTPVTEDLTTTIFKVNALLKKVPGNGFVNYYIDDLDGETGSYTYTQCNGSDFAWLDAFDGKICTVYLSVINAKSSTSGCVYRFVPVLVLDENFDVSMVNPAEFAVEYFGVPQFLAVYTGNPALELVNSVSSDLLGFKDVALSYSSSDSSVASVDNNVLTCKKTGTVTITVTGTYGDKTYAETVQISVEIPEAPAEDYATVTDAIAAQVGDSVTVKGIVGPSLVNRSGFYLIDDTGLIAIITDAETLVALKPGNEVVLEGKRHINTNGGANYHGQTCLIDAKLVVNHYGSHAYADDFFVTDKTLADFYALDIKTDYTTTVFVLKATVVVEETQFYSKIYLSDGATKVTLYSSSAGQYSWLKKYAGEEITVEMAACNWNDKKLYTGCVLAVVNEDGSKEINELNFQN